MREARERLSVGESSKNEQPSPWRPRADWGPLGVPKLGRVDLEQRDRVVALFRCLTVRRILFDTPQAWMWLMTAIERTHGARNPPALLGWMLNHPSEVLFTGVDEDRAAARLRAWRGGGPMVSAEDERARQKRARRGQTRGARSMRTLMGEAQARTRWGVES